MACESGVARAGVSCASRWLLCSAAACVWSAFWPVALTDLTDSTVRKSRALLAKKKRSANECEQAADGFRTALLQQPLDVQLNLDLADALNCVMRIKTDANMLRLTGSQETPEKIRVWKELGPEAWEHAHFALKYWPRSPRAASVYADAFQYMTSVHGPLPQAIRGSGKEFRKNARRMQQVGPEEEGGLGFVFEGTFFLAAPWPIRSLDEALVFFSRALNIKKCRRNFYYVGLVQYHMQHWADAIEAFTQARNTAPEFLSEFDFAEALTKEATLGIKLCQKKLAM
ncbi:unnamed protein product [Effrenium voratum]|uniref:Tetratricopeptide repeat protein n=1 Tax=Effrenium voratum TaxID=2562239 RepID=A0AA36II13_9DINO|nr:unnamed protein product [Effrenium voratum]CAJ1421207.1 unnamed protein product [Effrenium voratum]